jgi:sulfate adenylyltransferase subunit 2
VNQALSNRLVLQELENESLEIFRETAATFKNPVMMYSIGKDSSVLLHLAKKAFYPAPIPFPLLHIDTTWKFKEMISFRDRIAAESGVKLFVHTNLEGVKNGVNPFTLSASEYMKKNHGPRSESLACARQDINGIHEISVLSYGKPTIQN